MTETASLADELERRLDAARNPKFRRHERRFLADDRDRLILSRMVSVYTLVDARKEEFLAALRTSPATHAGDVEKVARALYEHWCGEVELAGGEMASWEKLEGKDIWLERATAALSTLPSNSREEVDSDYEVWQNGGMAASSSSEADARHYAMIYAQDGPVQLFRADTTRTLLATIERGDHLEPGNG